uniref:Subolesin-like protein n=1 Tax=Hyalomma anatolicum TaxID=176092 RepID=A0A0X9PMU2_9ACAR|nr:subolesin-like protein [Hyalomma anatolicum]
MACATLKRASSWDPLSPEGKPSKRRRFYATASDPTPPAPRHDPPTRPQQVRSSPFVDATPKMTTGEIEATVHDEMMRLQRRRQLCFQQGPPERAAVLDTLPLQGEKADQPVFTFRQVGLIIDRMVSEREKQLRGVYDAVLSAKLAEQYDAFVKFTHDQIRRRYDGVTPSYLS